MNHCLYCGKQCKFSYCNKICIRKFHARKKSEERKAARDAAPPALCEICKQPIEKPVHNQQVHSGECARIRDLREKAKRWHEKRAKIPIETRTCKCGCGATFEAKATSIRVWYGDKCKRLDQIAKGNTPQKYKAKKKNRGENYEVKKIEHTLQTITCRCPGCRKLHDHAFPYGWIGRPGSTPWKNCERYPYCISDIPHDVLPACDVAGVGNMAMP